MFRRYRWYTGAANEQKEMPSDIFFRNFWASFMVDTVGMDLRHRMNLDHLMWSTDYPHSGSDWPDSRVTIERVFRDVPVDEVKKMLHANCKALYGLDHIPDRLPGR
jgi:predicted TIM-barrel fold metal-dependent hydrolase